MSDIAYVKKWGGRGGAIINITTYFSTENV